MIYKLQELLIVDGDLIPRTVLEFDSLPPVVLVAAGLIREDKEIIEVNSIHNIYKIFKKGVLTKVKMYQSLTRIIYVSKSV